MAQTAEGAIKIRATKIGLTVEEYKIRQARGLKYCYGCNEWKATSEYRCDASRFDGMSPLCADCRNASARKRYVPVNDDERKPHGPPRKKRDNGDKLTARHLVNRLVQRGKLPRPNELPCFDCGHVWIKGGPRHEYDHYLGYDVEHFEAVQPVCKPCHVERDNLRKKQTHCLRGHEFTPENTILNNHGGRTCRECRRERDRRRGRDAQYWRDYRVKRKSKNG